MPFEKKTLMLLSRKLHSWTHFENKNNAFRSRAAISVAEVLMKGCELILDINYDSAFKSFLDQLE